MTTNAYTAKSALVALLQANTGVGQPLEGVDVAYAWTKDLGRRCVYGGWVAFDQESMVAEGPGQLMREDAVVNLYARAADNPPSSVQTTDTAVDGIVTGVGAVLKANPQFGDGYSWTAIRSGNGDYSETDDETTSIMVLRVALTTRLIYG